MRNELIVMGKLAAWAKENAHIEKLMKSEYGELLLRAYNALDTSVLYQSRIHGCGHIERTMLLGAFISQALELSAHECRMLLLCCSYHDIGRSNDFRDNEHGNVAAKKLMASNMKRKFSGYSAEDFKIMQAAITLHSMSDKEIDNVAHRYGLEPRSMDRYYRVAKCLKDSDNLDRVRLHDLDTKHLRHVESIGMVSDAQWIYDAYRRAKQ
ncbi:MAG: hypothetical protein Q4A83_06665 [Bacillota bacterium]|nr:hypothetical protein [Bacillota bacterium]